MPKYHINPETNTVGICKASVRECKFGPIEHFEDKKDAEKIVELKNKEKLNKIEQMRNDKKLPKKLVDYSLQIKEELNSTMDWLAKNRARPKTMQEFENPLKAANWCSSVSESIVNLTHYSEKYNGPKLNMETIEFTNAPYLNNHTANYYIDKNGEKFIIDYTYAQIDDEATIPYITTYENWKSNVKKAAYDPKESVKNKLYNEKREFLGKNITYFPDSDFTDRKRKDFINKIKNFTSEDFIKNKIVFNKSYPAYYKNYREGLKNENFPISFLEEEIQSDPMNSEYKNPLREGLSNSSFIYDLKSGMDMKEFDNKWVKRYFKNKNLSDEENFNNRKKEIQELFNIYPYVKKYYHGEFKDII